MKTKQYAKSFGLVCLGVTLATASAAWAEHPKMKMTTDIPVSITTPDKVKTSIGKLKYFDGVPTHETVDNKTWRPGELELVD